MPQVLVTFETPSFVINSAGEFEGRALTFGQPDVNYGLTFAPDAFDASIAARGAKGIKMLREHDTACLIGVWTTISRDESGLFVRGKLVLETEEAQDVLALMQAGALDGLSVAFEVQSQDGNTVTKADLFEISVVAFPASPGAYVGLGDGGIRVYKSNGELPKRVRTMLPSAAQTIYRQAHNKYVQDHPETATFSRALVAAWRAVGKHFAPQSKEAVMWVQKLNHDGDTLSMSDDVTLDSLRRTDDGYLTANAKVARTGIQVYRGFEVGRPDMETVRVYRPDSEVFSKDALHSFAHRPVTVDHPPEMVDAANWKEYAVGQTGDEIARDGEFVRVPLVLMDAAAIQAVEAGKRQLSMGYTTELKWQPGKTKDGLEYDAVQTSIRGNHLAVVARARGGAELRIGDQHQHGHKEDFRMTDTTKTMIVDELEIKLADDASEKILKRYFSKVEGDMVALKKKLGMSPQSGESKSDFMARCQDAGNDAAACATAYGKANSADEALAAKDAEIATLRKQLTDAEAAVAPAALDALAKDRGDLISQAKKMIGDKLVADGKTNAEIRRQVVDSFMGDTSSKWTDAQIETSFATLAAKDSKAPVNDGSKKLASVLSDAKSTDVQAIRDAAHAKYVERTTTAWKPKAA